MQQDQNSQKGDSDLAEAPGAVPGTGAPDPDSNSPSDTGSLHARMSLAGVVQTTSAAMDMSVVGLLMGQERIEASKSGAAIVAAGNEMTVTQGGGSILAAGNRLDVRQGGGALLVAGNRITVNNGFAGIAAARSVEIGAGARLLLTTPQAAVFGGMFGLMFALASRFLRGR